MRADYTLITGGISEKDLVKMINENIKRLTHGDPRVKEILKKKKHTGIMNPFESEKEFRYEYEYKFNNRYANFYAELYPNVNVNQEIKFKVEGAIWNLYIHDRRKEDEIEKNGVIIDELLKDVPVKYVLVKAYTGTENRI